MYDAHVLARVWRSIDAEVASDSANGEAVRANTVAVQIVVGSLRAAGARGHGLWQLLPVAQSTSATHAMALANNYAVPSTMPPDAPSKRVDILDMHALKAQVTGGESLAY